MGQNEIFATGKHKLKDYSHVLTFQSLLVAQQLASAVSGVMSGGAPGLNQPILIPFNAGGHLGGQQGLVLSLPTAANIQGLVAAAAAGGIMTLPLQNLQGESPVRYSVLASRFLIAL